MIHTIKNECDFYINNIWLLYNDYLTYTIFNNIHQ